MPEIVGSAPLSRRSTLCGLTLGLAIPGVVAGCGGGQNTTSDQPATESALTTGKQLAAVSDIPDGGGLVVTSGSPPIVLTNTAGTIRAFDATCPHQGTTVNAPQDGTITCPNHGSQFNPATGAVIKGPAERGLSEIAIMINNGQITVA